MTTTPNVTQLPGIAFSSGDRVVLPNGTVVTLSNCRPGVDGGALVDGQYWWPASRLASCRLATDDERRLADAQAAAHEAAIQRSLAAGERLVSALDSGRASADSDY